MVRVRRICHVQVKLAILLLSSMSGCDGHLELHSSYSRYLLHLLINNTINMFDAQEIKPGMIEQMKPKLSFSQSEIQDGDVICFQVDLPDKE
jgi:hypothetical protein